MDHGGLGALLRSLASVGPSARLAAVRGSYPGETWAALLFTIDAADADGTDGSAPPTSGAEWFAMLMMRMIRVLALPSRSNTISMPDLRRKVAARRSRPASALGLAGQVFELTARSPAIFARAVGAAPRDDSGTVLTPPQGPPTAGCTTSGPTTGGTGGTISAGCCFFNSSIHSGA